MDKYLNIVMKYKSLFRFAIVGCINTGADFMTFTILYSYLGADKFICQIVGYSMGIINSFIMNKIWTFKDNRSKTNTMTQFVKFVGINILSLGISLVGLNLLNDRLDVSIYAAKVIVTVFLQIFNYVAYKGVVFNKKVCRV